MVIAADYINPKLIKLWQIIENIVLILAACSNHNDEKVPKSMSIFCHIVIFPQPQMQKNKNI